MVSNLTFICVFATAIFVLVLALSMPVVGRSQGFSRKKFKNRLEGLSAEYHSEVKKLLRDQRRKSMSRLAQWFEDSPLFSWLSDLVLYSGTQTNVARVIGQSLFLVSAVIITGLILHIHLMFISVLIIIGLCAPVFHLNLKKNKRIDVFEQSLPDAIDVMKRAIKAGYPLVDSLRVVGDELDGPVAEEFRITFMDINYGTSIPAAFNAMLERMPSTTLLALVTSVIVQKESGGNLTEILERINHVIRGRTRFQRRVKTLSAEGRFSAWILALMPFFMIILLQVVSPGYMKPLFESPKGLDLIGYSLVGMFFGVLWMRQIIKIRV